MSVRIIGALFAVAMAIGTCNVAASLEDGFADPPKDCRPEVWWCFGYCNTAPDVAITRDLEAMRFVGIFAFHIYGGDVTRPGWLQKAKRLTRTNISHYKAGDKLLPSGLLGPVTLQVR